MYIPGGLRCSNNTYSVAWMRLCEILVVLLAGSFRLVATQHVHIVRVSLMAQTGTGLAQGTVQAPQFESSLNTTTQTAYAADGTHDGRWMLLRRRAWRMPTQLNGVCALMMGWPAYGNATACMAGAMHVHR